MTDSVPLFTAVANGARPLYLLLRCLGFAPKVQVQITHDGLRFTVEEARAMQGMRSVPLFLFHTSSLQMT